MVHSAREVCGSLRVEGKNPKEVWWNDVVKAAWKDILEATDDKVAKDRCIEVYKEEKKKIKRCIYQSKK